MTDVQISELLNTVVEFYDPHPSLAGATKRFPTLLQQIADDIAGNQLSLQEVRERFAEALATLGSGNLKITSSSISIIMPSIAVWRKCGGELHMWKAISYRPEIEALDDEFTRDLKKRVGTYTDPSGFSLTPVVES